MKWLIAGLSSIVLLVAALMFFPLAEEKPSETSGQINEAINNITQKEVKFIVFGDSGNGSAQQKQLAKVMLDYKFDLMLHTGDVAYNSGKETELQKYFFDIYSEHLKRAPMYPSPGNHDYQTQQASPYLAAFELPTNALRTKDKERYYSFDKENIHFVALDTNTPLYEVSTKVADDMGDWLEKDLSDSNSDGKKKWKIVYFHHPPYSSGKEHGEDLRVQQKLVPIFEKYGVDVVFSGHEHNYERTCELRSGKCEVGNGITYIVTGGGGAGLYGFQTKQESYTAFRKSAYHFMNISIDGCKFHAEAIDIDKTIIDSFDISKCN